MFFRYCIFAVLLFSFAIKASAADFLCFERAEKKNVSRIVGPSESYGLRDYPWMINLAFNNQQFCGGSLINRDLVLTAAHCIINNQFVVRRSTANGTANGEQRQVIAILVHRQYDPKTHANDIALLRLDHPFDISPAELPRMLPRHLSTHWGQSNDCARVIGWGATHAKGPLSNTLLGTDVVIWPNNECQKSYPTVSANNICAGYKEGKRDSCQGDSGGPLFVRGGPTGVYLVGIASYGRGCAAANYPGVYARISEFFNWVHQNAKSVR